MHETLRKQAKILEALGQHPNGMRLTEMAGMAIIFWGLGMGPWWLIVIGGVMVVGSYAAYRRTHGPFPPGEGGLDGMGDGGGGD